MLQVKTGMWSDIIQIPIVEIIWDVCIAGSIIQKTKRILHIMQQLSVQKITRHKALQFQKNML